MVDPKEYSSGVYTEIIQVPSGPRLQLDERSLLLIGPPYLVEEKVLLDPCVTGTTTLNIVADTTLGGGGTILTNVVGESPYLWMILGELSQLTEVSISGPEIPGAAKIASFDANANTITMSHSATATQAAVEITLTLHADDQSSYWLFLKDGVHPVLKPHIEDYLEDVLDIRLYYREQGSSSFVLAGSQVISANYNEEDDQVLATLDIGADIPDTASLFADVKVWREGFKGVYTAMPSNMSYLFGPRSARYQSSLTAYNTQQAINISGMAVNVFFPGREDTLATIMGEIERLTDYFVVPQIRVGGWLAPDINAYDQVMDAFSTYATSMSAKECRKEKMVYFAYPVISLQRIAAATWDGDYGDRPALYNAKDDILEEATRPLFINNKRVILVSEYYGKVGNTEIEGCDIATIIAAERYKLPLTYSTTFDVVPVLSHIRSVGFWEAGDLVDLRNRGWYVIHQEDIGRPIEVYQQVTTEQADDKLEESNVIVLDSLARTIRGTFAALIANGTINRISRDLSASLTKQTLDRIRAATAGIRAQYVDMNEFLVSVDIDDIIVDTNNPDIAYVVIRVRVYYAVNRINTYIFVV